VRGCETRLRVRKEQGCGGEKAELRGCAGETSERGGNKAPKGCIKGCEGAWNKARVVKGASVSGCSGTGCTGEMALKGCMSG